MAQGARRNETRARGVVTTERHPAYKDLDLSQPCILNTVELLYARGDDVSTRAATLITMLQDRVFELGHALEKIKRRKR